MNDFAQAALAPFQRDFIETALQTGYGRWCGLELIELQPGSVRMRFRPRAEMLTPWNTLSGSVINGVLEMPAVFSLLLELEAGELPVTNDIFVQHLRPLPNADYELTGTLLRRGRTMAWAESAALVDGKIVSVARVTKTLTKRG